MAYVAEMKNTLSGLFFLGSIFYFLRWLKRGSDIFGHGAPSPCLPPAAPDTATERRGYSETSQAPRLWYGISLLCAALAMASKSSTVVLPVVLGLCVWWMEGRVPRRRVVALGPLVLMAVAASALTLWTQRMTLAQTSDAQWARPWPGRWVSAGEAVWFYLGKLLWPHPLMAVYPRWQVDAGAMVGVAAAAGCRGGARVVVAAARVGVGTRMSFRVRLFSGGVAARAGVARRHGLPIFAGVRSLPVSGKHGGRGVGGGGGRATGGKRGVAARVGGEPRCWR